MLQGKRIVLGVTGSIAAYKSCLLARLLVTRGAQVQCVMTPAAREFITPLTLSTLTRRPVVSEFFDRRDGTWHSHVDLGLWADAMLVAPATASTIGKMARGIADNMLLTTYLSMKAPVLVAPAMDLDMYAHPATQANLAALRSYGNLVIEPDSGPLASQLQGKGRMREPDSIAQALDDLLGAGGELRGARVMVTAGPTYEKIDPVRFIGNYSSGKMGYALAEECAARGAEVTLISGPTALSARSGRVTRVDVESADQMTRASLEAFPRCDIAILCAAVADYTPLAQAPSKMKRGDGALTLELRPTDDIARALGQAKRPGQLTVGFALETDNETSNARRKLEAKNLDLIVLNSLNDEGAGFRHDTNKVTLITRGGEEPLPLKSKTDVARDIVDRIIALRR